MLKQSTRQMVFNALTAANLHGNESRKLVEDFLGGRDLELSEIDLDSLATMEFCIYLELNYEVLVIPHQVHQYHSFNELALDIEEWMS